jgi:hypothetical protein
MTIAILESYVPEPNTGCWLWLRGVNSDGYPLVRIEGKSYRVSRLMWEIHKGPIPPNMRVCHRCDVRLYINPEHLFLGTDKDNYDDMVAKGRKAKFDYKALSPLTPDHVDRLRLDRQGGLSFSKLAKRYGVSIAAAWKVVNFHSWRGDR